MLDPETNRNTVEWRLAGPEDAAIWVAVTRRSADQIPFESEDAPVGRLRFFTQGDTAQLDGLVLLPEAGGSVAAQVVTEALARAAALNMRHIEATYPAAYIASFASAGFEQVRSRTGMMASTNISIPPPPIPASLRVRQMTEGDLDHVGTLLQRAYMGGPDNRHPDLAGWRGEVRAIYDGSFGPFLPESCFVVEHTLDRFNLAGALLTHIERGIPRIRHTAVAPTFRHVGLGQLLVVKAMQRLHEQGYASALLYVTLGIPAVNLYRRLGFVEVGPTYIEAERKLSSTGTLV